MGQDQHSAGPRRLDEAERGDGLAGAGGVLEPEATVGAGVLGRALGGDVLVELVLSSRQSCGSTSSARSSLGVLLFFLLPRLRARRRRRSRCRRRPARRREPCGRGRRRRSLGDGCRCCRSPLRCASASSAVSVPDSASTWWAERTVPSARCGSSSESSRSSPSSSEYDRRHSSDGTFSPASTSASAASSARLRAEPGASASSSVSPSWTKRSRVSFSARAIAAALGKGVGSPMVIERLRLDESEPRQSSWRLKAVSAHTPSQRRDPQKRPPAPSLA